MEDVEKGKRSVVLISEIERKLADDKLNSVVANSSPAQVYFCEDDDIDIKIEVIPSIEDMGIDIGVFNEGPLSMPTLTCEAPQLDTPVKPKRRKEASSKPKPYLCPICKSVGVERAFSKPCLLKGHILYHKKTGRAILTHRDTVPEADADKSQTYTCQTCNNRIFSSKTDFRRHQYFHRLLIKKYGQDGNRPILPKIKIPIQDKYTCTTCQKEFEDRKKFLEHLKGHRKQKSDRNILSRPRPTSTLSAKPRSTRSGIPFADEYKCPKCDKVYEGKARSAYRYHIKRHTQLEEAEEKRRKRLERMRPDIPMQESYHCEMCDRNWNSSERIRYINHVRCHEQMERNGVNRPIAEKKERDSNADNEEEEEEADYYCQTCDKHFDDKTRFSGHMRYHKQLQARGQDRPIATWETREASWKDKIPSGLDTYTCETCPNRSFDNRSAFLSHVIIHRSLKKKGCDRPVMTKEEWSQKCQKKSTCDICNETFETARDYNEHQRVSHPKAGPSREGVISWKDLVPEQDIYTCDICPGRQFTDRHNYIGHLKIHKSLSRKGEDRPIMSREQWGQRMKVPREIRPRLTFNCTTCDKSFWKRVTYRSHMRYHAILKRKGEDRVIGQKGLNAWKDIPYQETYTCDKCSDRTFDKRETYIGHLKYHKILERKGKVGTSIPRKGTGNLELICKMCNRTFDDSKSYWGHKAYHRQIRKKTGEDRPIGKKSDVPSTTGAGSSVNDLVASMMEDLNKFGCGCGERFYFKDALLHHLTLALNENCAEVTIKTEVVERPEESDAGPPEDAINFCEVSSYQEDEAMTPESFRPETITEAMTIAQQTAAAAECNDNKNETGGEETMENANVMSSIEDEEYLESDSGTFPSHDEPFEVEEDVLKDPHEVVSPVVNPLEEAEEGEAANCENEENEKEESMSAFYQCQICNLDSNSLTEYLRHQYQLHLIDQTSPLPCPFCELQFKLGSELFVHCKGEHDEISSVEEFTIPCPSCGITIDVVEGPEMEQHFKKEHPKVVCRMCQKIVSAPALLNKHIVMEHLKRKK